MSSQFSTSCTAWISSAVKQSSTALGGRVVVVITVGSVGSVAWVGSVGRAGSEVEVASVVVVVVVVVVVPACRAESMASIWEENMPARNTSG